MMKTLGICGLHPQCHDKSREVEVFVSETGEALCREHLVGMNYVKCRDAAVQIAAAFAFGFAGKTSQEIAKLSWDMAAEVFVEGLRQTRFVVRPTYEGGSGRVISVDGIPIEKYKETTADRAAKK